MMVARCLFFAIVASSMVACEFGSDEGKAVAPDAGAAAPKPDPGVEVTKDAGAPSHDAGAEAEDAAGDASALSCDFPTTCPTTRGIGTVSGDTDGDGGGNSVATTGTGSEWLSVRVTEDDSSLIGRALSLTASLTPAPGTEYEVYLYVNDGSAKAECTNVAEQAMLNGTSGAVSTSWGEGTFANDKDDSATITVRVQHVSGPCGSNAAWSLDLKGHTQ
jgi:hypothetical protein